MMITTKRVSPSAEETPSESNAGWIQSAVAKVAQTWVFKAILRQLDAFLWVVEKSAEWSLPQNEGEADESTKADLVRPLPWMLFLPTLLFLRIIRASLNVFALMLGYPEISSTSMVKFAQKSRCRLANIGNTNRSPEKTRHKRDTQDKRLSMNRAKKALIRSIRLTLSTLSCLDGSKPSLSPPPTRIHVSALDLDAAATPESTDTPNSKDKQREKVTPAIESDISTETEPPKRNHRLVPESYDSHNVEITDEAVRSRAEERSCEEKKSCAGRNEEDEATEESNVEEYDSNEEKEEEEEEEECDLEKSGKSEYDEEESDKVECDKAECDLMEQPDSSNPEGTSAEKTPALSQDSDTHFYSPIESSASRSRSSSNSSVSNDNARQSEENSPASNTYSSIPDSQRKNTLKTNECGNGEARFITEETTTTSGGKIDVTKSRCSLPTGRSYEETNNGTVVGKRGTNAAKYHHHHYRGKRTSHGNRKKK